MLKLFNVQVHKKTPEDEICSDTLGIGANSKTVPIGQCMSFDINMNKDCKDFKESVKHQRQMLIDEFKKHLDLLYNLIIYVETKHYKADKSTNPITYIYKGESKIHWHGILTFNYKMSRQEYERFFRIITDRFTIKSQCNKHRALFYKTVKDRKHRKMRLHYMVKQNSPEPICYNINL